MDFRPAELAKPRSESFPGDARVRAFMLTNLRETLKVYGVDPEPVFQGAGLRPELLADDYNWIPLETFATILTLSAAATGDSCFGLKYGGVARFTSNPLGYLMANAPDLRTALKSFTHFHAVISSNPITLLETKAGARLEWSYPVTLSNSVQITDFVLMRFLSRIRPAAGSAWRPVAVGFSHRAPSDLAEYEKLVGPRIAFDQPMNTIVIANATLALPMPHADPQLFKLLTRFCDEQLQGQKAANNPLNQIRETMRACLELGNYGPQEVAKLLGIAPAALHRRLKIEGSSFQRLLDDTRRCLTHRYLMETSLKLTDIATKVGYSELSAFSRASRRWFGMSPRCLRRAPSSLNEAA